MQVTYKRLRPTLLTLCNLVSTFLSDFNSSLPSLTVLQTHGLFSFPQTHQVGSLHCCFRVFALLFPLLRMFFCPNFLLIWIPLKNYFLNEDLTNHPILCCYLVILYLITLGNIFSITFIIILFLLVYYSCFGNRICFMRIGPCFSCGTLHPQCLE